MSEKTYHDGTRLLSLLDADKKIPEIYIDEENRSSGKTTYYAKMMVNRYLNKKKKFALLYRYKEEIKAAKEKFWDVIKYYYPNYNFDYKTFEKDTFGHLYLNGKIMGYTFSLRAANKIRNLSAHFNDTDAILFDEFQPLDNNYLSDEISRFISIHVSIARGNGKRSRYLPVYLVSNGVSIINPYYTELGISAQINDQENQIIRGKGYVFQRGVNKEAREELKESRFLQSFEDSEQFSHVTDNSYIISRPSMICKLKQGMKYYCSIKYNNKYFSIWKNKFQAQATEIYDPMQPLKYAISINEVDEDFIYLPKNSA